MIRQTSNYTAIDMDWMPSSEEPKTESLLPTPRRVSPQPININRPPLFIRTPQRRPTLTEENLVGLKTVDINTPEWNIQVGNTKPEHIPNNLKIQRKSVRRRRGSRRHRRRSSRASRRT
jgi:hypothetical protein